MKFFMKKIAAAAMATGVVLGMGMGSASAAPTFTIDPSAILGNLFATVPFDATVFGGTSSELLHITSATTNAGTGWVQITSASNGAVAVTPLESGLLVDYQLYLTFSLASTLLTGTNGGLGSTYKITGLDFSVWADPSFNPGPPAVDPGQTTFIAANAAGNIEATVAGTADDILLAVGNLVGEGTAVITVLGGAALNAINTFAVCNGVGTADLGGVPVAVPGCTAAGAAYFSLPDPFYELAFSGFNNASLAVQYNDQGTASILDDVFSVNDAVAAITFNNVPEPGSIALMGIALAGLGVSSRRGKKSNLA